MGIGYANQARVNGKFVKLADDAQRHTLPMTAEDIRRERLAPRKECETDYHPGKRICLKCRNKNGFHSEGIHNRICPTCSNRNRLIAESDAHPYSVTLTR